MRDKSSAGVEIGTKATSFALDTFWPTMDKCSTWHPRRRESRFWAILGPFLARPPRTPVCGSFGGLVRTRSHGHHSHVCISPSVRASEAYVLLR